MDARVRQQRMNRVSNRKSPSKVSGNTYSTANGDGHSIVNLQDHSAPREILLIGCEQTARVYTDEVLRRAGFGVRVLAPREAMESVNNDGHEYPVVVFSNTLNTQDISEIGDKLRERRSRSRLLLMLGPDPTYVNSSLFDATLESLEGPVALIRIVRRLAEAAMLDDSHGMSA